jgi:RNA polymerase sigma factor (sigma-70 family)
VIFADPECHGSVDAILMHISGWVGLMRNAVIAASPASCPSMPRFAGTLPRTQPDSRLAKLAGEGCDAAFEEIVRRYRSALVAFAARIASRDSADDVVQDSMVKAHSALLRGDRPDTPRAWLFRIVRNTALNERRDRRAHEYLDEGFDGVEQPLEAADRRRQLQELVVAMGDLPRTQREALIQRELEGKGHDEIAADLEVSPGAVRQIDLPRALRAPRRARRPPADAAAEGGDALRRDRTRQAPGPPPASGSLRRSGSVRCSPPAPWSQGPMRSRITWRTQATGRPPPRRQRTAHASAPPARSRMQKRRDDPPPARDRDAKDGLPTPNRGDSFPSTSSLPRCAPRRHGYTGCVLAAADGFGGSGRH